VQRAFDAEQWAACIVKATNYAKRNLLFAAPTKLVPYTDSTVMTAGSKAHGNALTAYASIKFPAKNTRPSTRTT
jgi:hypothetical protein